MHDQRRMDLALYRLEHAFDDLHAAESLLSSEKYRQANNRAYYAMFHAIRALLALESVDIKKHSSVIAYFRQNYIKDGKVDISLSDMITSASLIRNQSDYDDFYLADKAETEQLLADAGVFCETIKKCLGN